MKVSFKLSMPNVGSWNGKWTGAGREYYYIKTLSTQKGNEFKQLIGDRTGFYYNFDDGWGQVYR